MLSEQYESSKLTVLSTTGKPIGEKQYYLLRIFQDNNNLIDWEKTPKIDAQAKPINYNYYPDLCFQAGGEIPAMLFIDTISFKRSFLVNEHIKMMMDKEGFRGFEFYTLFDFVQELQNRQAVFASPSTLYRSTHH